MARSAVINKGYRDAESDIIFTGFSGFPSSGEEPAPAYPPRMIDTPYVGGAGAIGETLTCTMGNWTGEPTSYAYQWCANGITVSEEGPAYVVQASDAGKAIACIVTATNAAGSTQAAPSNQIAIPAMTTRRS